MEFIDNGLRTRSIRGSDKHFIREDGVKITKLKSGKLRYSNGYVRKEGYVVISDGKTNGGIAAHRAVAEAFIPNPDNKPMVDHIDNDRCNNNVNNLRWVTNAENVNYYHKKQKYSKKESIESALNKIHKDNEKLYKKINELENEIKILKSDNGDLRRELNVYSSVDINDYIEPAVVVNNINFVSSYSASNYIVHMEKKCGVTRNINTVYKEIKILIKEQKNRLMYNKYKIITNTQ
jgi:hypothetical protein